MPKYLNQEGTTLLEMAIAMIMFGVLLVVIAGSVTNFLVINSNVDKNVQLQTDANQVFNSIVADSRSATWLLSSTDLSNLDPNYSDYSSGSFLGLAVASKDSSGNFLYPDSTHLSVCTDTIIYYKPSGQSGFYRRLIKNAGSNTACTTNNAMTNGTKQLASNISSFNAYGPLGVGHAYATTDRALILALTYSNKDNTGHTSSATYTAQATLAKTENSFYSAWGGSAVAIYRLSGGNGFGGTCTINGSGWTGSCANVTDGNTTTSDSQSTLGSTSSNFIDINGTSAPSTETYRIVRVSVWTCGATGAGNITASLYSSGTLVGTSNASSSCSTTGSGAGVTALNIASGWTWSIVHNLEAKVYNTTGTAQTFSDIYIGVYYE